MNDHKALRCALAWVIASLSCATAQAAGGLFRAYLASDGSDGNPCTLALPCRLLPAALAAVADGGEIWMLDSANFNTSQVNIAKSVTILAIPAAAGSVVATGGGDAINITAGNVTLRNLVVVPIPGGGGVHGIVMSGAGKLSVENGLIYNLQIGNGIRVTGAGAVRIVNTLVRDNSSGIWIQGGASADISGTRVQGNSNFGLRVNGNASGLTTTVAVSDCVMTGNAYGISAYADNATAVSRVSVIRSTMTNNQIGVRSESFLGTVVVTLGGSMVTGNDKGLSQVGAGATLESLGNNILRQNTGLDDGTITTVPPG